MIINDAHCHFFGTRFLTALGRQLSPAEAVAPEDVASRLGWAPPEEPAPLADRWVAELDRHGVSRAALIASIPGDEQSVATAVARHPSRFVGFFMVDPAAADAVERTTHATTTLGLRAVCLFPAMHHVALGDQRVLDVVKAAAQTAGVVLFVHCGVLSVGVRRKLGLASPFDMRLGDPLGVARLAQLHPEVPFVIPHFGAGMLREALMAADSCPNLFLDTSSSNGWIRYQPGLTIERVFEAALRVAGASRLLFGTDSSFFPRGWQQAIHDAQRSALTALGVTESEQAMIFGGNFDRIFSGAPAPRR